jgi:hypothetical protein
MSKSNTRTNGSHTLTWPSKKLSDRQQHHDNAETVYLLHSHAAHISRFVIVGIFVAHKTNLLLSEDKRLHSRATQQPEQNTEQTAEQTTE